MDKAEKAVPHEEEHHHRHKENAERDVHIDERAVAVEGAHGGDGIDIERERIAAEYFGGGNFCVRRAIDENGERLRRFRRERAGRIADVEAVVLDGGGDGELNDEGLRRISEYYKLLLKEFSL